MNALMCPSFFKTKAPELSATRWYNSPPLKWKELRGKVVLIDFMTYSCVNCVRTFPHMRYLWSQLKEQGLVIIGVQSPEFQFEKDFHNIEDAIKRRPGVPHRRRQRLRDLERLRESVLAAAVVR